jgi:hypothetical protein
MVRMSYPRSMRCVAKLCRRVLTVAFFTMPARATASLNACCSVAGSRWYRRTRPDSGSIDRRSEGNTQNQPHSAPAPGYFREGLRNRDSLHVPSAILLVGRSHLLEVMLEVSDDAFRQHRFAVLVALAGTYREAASIEIDVLHPKRQALAQAESSLVDDERHQPIDSSKMTDDPTHFVHRENHRQMVPDLGSHHRTEIPHRHRKHIAE